jgi:hypothetical protein
LVALDPVTAMQLFAPDSNVLRPKRAINLGGASSSSGSDSVLERARLERVRRDENRRRESKAMVIQVSRPGSALGGSLRSDDRPPTVPIAPVELIAPSSAPSMTPSSR